MKSATLAFALLLLASCTAQAAPVRVAYFYDYMSQDHLDSLAHAGFDRGMVHWISDSLDTRGAARLGMWADRGAVVGIEIEPEWVIQAPARLATRPASRRYTWGPGTVETSVACPLDSLYWRSALLDRAEEFLRARPGLRRLAVDFELYGSSSRHHYDAGPCRCASCLAEYSGGRSLGDRDAAQLSGLMGWEESRVATLLSGLLAEFAAAHPGVAIDVLDLDFASFVHRGAARAFARSGVPVADYCESTYAVGGGPVGRVRSRLARLGLPNAAVIGGVWLKRFAPKDLAPAIASINAVAQGYFVFTTFSLWQDPAKLTGPYTLLGDRASYWQALRQANAP
jgi:hypothetical protein